MAMAASKVPDDLLLAAGDPLPAVHLCDQDGKDIDIYNDTIAGDPVVLFLCPDGQDAEALVRIARFSELAADFKRTGAHVFVVTGQTAEANRALAETLEGELKILSDAKGDLLGAFGLAMAGAGSKAKTSAPFCAPISASPRFSMAYPRPTRPSPVAPRSRPRMGRR